MTDTTIVDLLKSIDKLEEQRDMYIAKNESPELINRLEQLISYHYGIANKHELDELEHVSENDLKIGKIVVHNGKIYRTMGY